MDLGFNTLDLATEIKIFTESGSQLLPNICLRPLRDPIQLSHMNRVLLHCKSYSHSEMLSLRAISIGFPPTEDSDQFYL